MTKRQFTNRLLIVVTLIAIGFSGFLFYKLHRIEKNSPDVIAKKEANDLLSKVAEIFLIPTGEEPTIATVSDPNALKDQSFFQNSQKGDKVLIFSKAGKAVLYRPSINKIIETSTIAANKNNSNPKQNDTTTPTTQGKDKTTF